MSSPHILVVDDEADIRGLLKEILSEEGYEVDVAANAAQARASRARQVPDLVLLDIWMPDVDGITLLREWSTAATDGCPVVMMSGHSTVETAVEATRLGAFDFVEKPLSLAKLLRTVERALDAGRRHRQSGKLLGSPLAMPIGKSKLMQQLRAEVQQLATNPAPVLLVGEPGCGREAVARYLHERGPHGTSAFVALVASSLREADAEERLFGTASSPGLLAEAGNGTLFIHELEDLPPSAQRLLVGVFESGQFMRAGGGEPVPFRARLVSSAQPGVEQRAGTDGVRRDLLAHLNVLIVRVRRCASTPRMFPSCCATRSTAWSMRMVCRSGVSRWRRRIACATTPGRTMCASCVTWYTACSSTAVPRRYGSRRSSANWRCRHRPMSRW